MVDLNAAMRALSSKRPIFHSEADFQHALAMQISKTEPATQVRLEFRPVSHERTYIDLWISDGTRKLAIELKYKTRSVSVVWMEERFDLSNQGAQPLGGYDVWKDVQRVERVCAHRPDVEGNIIFLSNDATYWKEPASEGTVGSDFRLHEGRVASGGLFWASNAGNGTMKNRDKPVRLDGTYHITWNDYSRLGARPGLTFRYTIIPVSAIGKKGTVVAVSLTEPTVSSESQTRVTTTQRGSKYSRLHDYLVALNTDRIELTFQKIEEIIGSSLPPSSRDHPASFWANHGGTHVWATQWMNAGWKVDSHSVAKEHVVFVREGPPNR